MYVGVINMNFVRLKGGIQSTYSTNVRQTEQEEIWK